MKVIKIGLISDTHSYLEEGVKEFFAHCDEIWHCGDVGEYLIIEELDKIAPVRVVYGNIDWGDVARKFPEYQLFHVGTLKVLMIHIGGYPGNYSPTTRQLILSEKPGLMVCGHSHILKIMFDKKHNCLIMNPGAAGNSGFHTVKTAIRFEIHDGVPKNVEVWEKRRG
jgi:uncharacterized protein